MLRVKLLEQGARLPVVAHPGEDLGYDLFSLEVVAMHLDADEAVAGHRGVDQLRDPAAIALRVDEAETPEPARRWVCWCATVPRWQPGVLRPLAA